jgi:digeranylgeranylglycerophospholipid reductase
VSVAIVGAGPAGLIAADILVRRGIEVSVFDKDADPGEKKPCAGMLRDAAVRMFSIPSKLASRRIRGIRVVLPNHRVEDAQYNHPIFWNLDRGVLGRHLINRVREAGAEVNTGTRLVDLTVLGSRTSMRGYELKFRTLDGRMSRTRTDLLIAADGVNSVVVNKTGVHQPFKPNELGQCVQYQLQIDGNLIEKRIGDMNEIYYGRDISPFGYAWIVPKDNIVTVGVGALLSMVKSNLKNYLDYLVKKHPVASGKLVGGKILRFETALCPLSGLVSPTYGDRLVVAGDAAGHCSSISGEGIHYSMVAGATAGRVCSEAVEAGDLSAGFLGKYEGAWRKSIGSDMKWGKWLQNIALRRGFMSGAFGKDTMRRSRLSKRVADILSGVKPYKESLIKAIPNFLIIKVAEAISESGKEDTTSHDEN